MGRVESRNEDQTAKGIGLPDDAAFARRIGQASGRLRQPDNYRAAFRQAQRAPAQDFDLALRYTGLRISDAVSLTTDRLDGRKMFLYTAKTGVPVYTILPDSVLRALEATPRVTETRFFWSGQGKRQTAVCDWQGKIKEVFDLAGIAKGLSNAVSHRLRDTFAVELLLAGVPIERLSMLLGHQSIRITEKHYAPWTRSRQEQIESDLTAAWKTDPMLSKKAGTKGVQIQKGPVN
jgi:integrase